MNDKFSATRFNRMMLDRALGFERSALGGLGLSTCSKGAALPALDENAIRDALGMMRKMAEEDKVGCIHWMKALGFNVHVSEGMPEGCAMVMFGPEFKDAIKIVNLEK